MYLLNIHCWIFFFCLMGKNIVQQRWVDSWCEDHTLMCCKASVKFLCFLIWACLFTLCLACEAKQRMWNMSIMAWHFSFIASYMDAEGRVVCHIRQSKGKADWNDFPVWLLTACLLSQCCISWPIPGSSEWTKWTNCFPVCTVCVKQCGKKNLVYLSSAVEPPVTQRQSGAGMLLELLTRYTH